MHELREPATEGGHTHADLITRRKAIHRLRINRRQLNRFVADGELAAVTTEGKGPHFERSEVERFRSSAALRRWKHRRYALDGGTPGRPCGSDGWRHRGNLT